MVIFVIAVGFTWHVNLTLFSLSIADNKGNSVGFTSPPPSVTWHLHNPQVALPPHADDIKILFCERIVNKVSSEVTSISFEPLMIIFLTPPLPNALSATMISPVMASMMPSKTVGNKIYSIILSPCFIFYLLNRINASNS